MFIALRHMFMQNKAKEYFEKRGGIPATTSGHLQLHALITCNSGQHFAGNSELVPAGRAVAGKTTAI